MTATPLRRTYRLCAGVLAASLSLPDAVNAQITRALPNNYSCYNTEAVAINNWNNIDKAAFGRAAKSVGAQSLRIPGGDTANYWNWESYSGVDRNGTAYNTEYGAAGGVTTWFDYTNNDPNDFSRFESRTPDIYPFFLPQELPVSLQFQNNTNATLANTNTFITASGADPVWVMNMNTSFLEKELAHLQTAASLGMSVNRIELGNELFFRGGFNTPVSEQGNYERAGSTAPLPQVGGYSNENEYAIDAKRWADEIRNIFPSAKIAVTGVADSANGSPRINNWMSALQTPRGADGRSALDAVDAFTIHPYYDAADLGVTKADVGNRGRAGDIARGGLSKLRTILNDDGISLTPSANYAATKSNNAGLAGKDVWVTEHNIIESDVVVLGNSWVGALMVDAHNHEFLKDSRTKLSCAHVLTGNAQWQAIADDDGTVVDPAKRGIDDLPFSNIAQPFSRTATGLVLGKSAEVFTEGTATLLHSGDASAAWRVENADGDKISAVNASDIDELLTLPAGKIWEVLTFTGDPWATITDEEELDILLEIVTGGSTISIPAFSKLLAMADPNAIAPQQPAGAEGDGEIVVDAEGNVLAAPGGAEETDPATEETAGVTAGVTEDEVADASAGEDAEAEDASEPPLTKAEARAKARAEKIAQRVEEAKARREEKQVARAEAKRVAEAKQAAKVEAKAEAKAERLAQQADAKAQRIADRLAARAARSGGAFLVESDEVSLLAEGEDADLLEVSLLLEPSNVAEGAVLLEAPDLLESADSFGAASLVEVPNAIALVEALKTSALANAIDTADLTDAIDAVLLEAVDTAAVANTFGMASDSASASSSLLSAIDPVLVEALDVLLAEAADSEVDIVTASNQAAVIEALDTVLAATPASIGLAISAQATAPAFAPIVLSADQRESKSVPEPAAVLGLGLMAASLTMSRRRRKLLKPGFSKVA